jgi:hypothetical protein
MTRNPPASSRPTPIATRRPVLLPVRGRLSPGGTVVVGAVVGVVEGWAMAGAVVVGQGGAGAEVDVLELVVGSVVVDGEVDVVVLDVEVVEESSPSSSPWSPPSPAKGWIAPSLGGVDGSPAGGAVVVVTVVDELELVVDDSASGGSVGQAGGAVDDVVDDVEGVVDDVVELGADVDVVVGHGATVVEVDPSVTVEVDPSAVAFASDVGVDVSPSSGGAAAVELVVLQGVVVVLEDIDTSVSTVHSSSSSDASSVGDPSSGGAEPSSTGQR